MINAAGDNAFDIHEKLKKHGAKWLYMHGKVRTSP